MKLFSQLFYFRCVKKKDIYLLLGTNLGDRFLNLASAINLIDCSVGKVIAKSSLLETEPWGFEAEQHFLNQALKIETHSSPLELLDKLKQLEKDMGRKAKTKEGYESRIIDIDILFYGSEVVNEPNLVIPHPQLQRRYFALKPLSEIALHHIHPVLKKSVETLLKENVQD